MVLIKSKPDTLFNERFVPQSFNQLMNAFFEDSKINASGFDFIPKADIIESEQHYEIHMALPGIKKEDIKISVDGDMLNIEGERKTSISEDTEKYVRRETRFGKFSRSFNIAKLDSSAIEAGFENGILTVKLPKQKADKQSVITIK